MEKRYGHGIKSRDQWGIPFYSTADLSKLNRLMEKAFFTNAPRDITFVGGDPAMLSKAKTVELHILGDSGLIHRLDDAFLKRKSGIYGLAVQEEVL
jgi:hypothetical protein